MKRFAVVAVGVTLSVFGGRLVDKLHYDHYCRSYHFDGVCPSAQCALGGMSFRGDVHAFLHPYFACQVRGLQNGEKTTLVISFKDAPMWEVEALAAHVSLSHTEVEIHQALTAKEPKT